MLLFSEHAGVDDDEHAPNLSQSSRQMTVLICTDVCVRGSLLTLEDIVANYYSNAKEVT